MPNINLRLTEEEHAALEVWAKDGHRSIQKEIIFRLFAGAPPELLTEIEATPAQIAASADRIATGRGLGYRDVEISRRFAEAEEDHFKPDFGKKLK